MYSSLIRSLLVIVLVLAGQESAQSGNIIQITSGEGNYNNVSNINSGCIRGDRISKQEKRGLTDFFRVFVDGTFEVQIRPQRQFSFQIEGDSNILPEIDSVVRGDELQITTRSSICPRLPLRIIIGMPDISRLRSDGASTIWISGINNRSFVVETDGSSDITVQGSTDNLSVSVLGAGDVHAFDLVAGSVKVDSEGAGDVEIFTNGELSTAIVGAGDVFYRGNPSQINLTEDGAGELIKSR